MLVPYIRSMSTKQQPTKYFVKIDGDSSGEMFVEPKTKAFDTFEEAKAEYRRLRLEDYVTYSEEEDEEFMRELTERIDALTDPGRDCVIDSFNYENSDLSDENTYMNLEISLVRSSTYKTRIVYEV